MMQELSMNIMDIVQNSVKAEATEIEIYINENIKDNKFIFSIKDNGKGMTKEFIKKVKDPFSTSRTTRKVGLGIPFVDQTCQMCNGKLDIQSEIGIGTTITATMEYNNIDRPPLGDIAATMQAIIISNPDKNFTYTHIYNDKEFTLKTTELKEILGDVPLTEPDVMQWIKEFIEENLLNIK